MRAIKGPGIFLAMFLREAGFGYPTKLMQWEERNMEKLNVGMIGAGFIGHFQRVNVLGIPPQRKDLP